MLTVQADSKCYYQLSAAINIQITNYFCIHRSPQYGRKWIPYWVY